MTRRKMELNVPLTMAPFHSISCHLFVTVWFHHSISPPWFLIRQAEDAAFKKRGKNPTKPNQQDKQKVTTEIKHWIRITLWISCACSGLEKRSILQLPKFHLLGSSTVLCTTGKCHCKMALLKVIFFSRCNHFLFSWMMMAREATDIFLCWLWDLGWCLNRYLKQTNRNNAVQVSGFFPASSRRC